MLTLTIFDNIFRFEGARHQNGPENLKKKKNVKPKIFIFKYFSKIPSEMDSTHPLYPILILQ